MDACYPAPETMRQRIEASFARVDPSGKAGAECWADYRQKLEAWHAHRAEFQALLAEWPAARAELAALARPPERVLEILRAIDAPLTFEDLDPPATPSDVRFAYLNAALMRKRLTIGDLLIFLGWDREALWEQAGERAFGPQGADQGVR
jgi:glycerol-1-phosphate dehydrogenase [NAD(P)+]